MNKVARSRLAAVFSPASTAVLTAFAALTIGASPALAGTFADVYVVNRTSGQRLPVYNHGGKLYVAGNPGDRYSVQVVNRTGGRILTVVSVDGVNVVSGETAAPEQTGYVFHGWQSYEINGWRKSANEVAAFYFTSLPDSYAARTDRPHNVGVIGVAVFREWTPPPRPRPQVPHPMPAPRSQSNEGAGAAADSATPQGVPGESNYGRRAESGSEARADARAEAPATPPPPAAAKSAEAERAAPSDAPAAPVQRLRERIGTGHGEREQSHVSYTNFRRASAQPNEVLTIHYDRYDNLVARGVIPGWPPVASEPRPFPAAPANVRFVPDAHR